MRNILDKAQSIKAERFCPVIKNPFVMKLNLADSKNVAGRDKNVLARDCVCVCVCILVCVCMCQAIFVSITHYSTV